MQERLGADLRFRVAVYGLSNGIRNKKDSTSETAMEEGEK